MHTSSSSNHPGGFRPGATTILALCCGVLALTSCIGCAGSSASFIGDPRMDRREGSHLTLSLRWRSFLSEMQFLDLWPREQARPAVAPDAGLIAAGGRDGRFVVLSLTDRTLQWRAKLPEPLTGEPLIHNGRLYVADGNGYLNAYDVRTGALYYRFYAGDELPSVPVAADDMLYLRTASGSVVAIDLLSGEFRWRYEAAVPARMLVRSFAAPVVTNTNLIAVQADGSVVALDLRSGGRLWVAELASLDAELVDIAGTPILSADGRTLFVALYEGGVFALSASEGSLKWKNDTVQRVVGLAWWRDELVASAAGRGLVGFDPLSGAENWSLQVCHKPKQAPTAPVAWGERLLMGCSSRGGGMLLFTSEPPDAAPVLSAEFLPGFGVYAAPRPVDDDTVALISNGGYLYILDYVPRGLPKRIPLSSPQNEMLPLK